MATTRKRCSSAIRWRARRTSRKRPRRSIDAEVRRLIDEAYTERHAAILTKKKKEWIAIAEGLLEYETLSGEEIKQLIAGQKPSRDIGDDTPTSRGSAVPKAGAGKRKKGPEPEGGMEPQPQG